MQEQNFEKQVQSTLDELSLTPSAPVWQKVEIEIRQKKKRRRVVAFWLLALLLAGGGTFWGLHSFSDRTSARSTPSLSVSNPTPQPLNNKTQETTVQEPATVTTAKELTNTPAGQAHTPEQEKKTPTTAITGAIGEGSTTKPAVVKDQREWASSTLKTGKTKSRVPSTSKATIAKEKKKRTTDSPLIHTEEIIASTTTQPEAGEENNSSSNPFSTDQATDSAATVAVEPAIVKTDEAIPAVDSTQNKKGQTKKAKWSWSAQAGYGISSLQKDFLSKALGAPEVYSSPVLNSGSPAPSFNRSVSALEKGASFHLAATAKRHLNNRFALSGGLQYSYFSTKNMVGQTVQRDTVLVGGVSMDNVVLGQFYRAPQGGTLKEYTNNYHFLELPIGLEWQVHKRLPLHLQTGISVSYLVSTNALLFDRTAGIYYKNDDQLQKTQLHTYTGLTYRVWRYKGYGIHVGPYLQYGISNLQKAENTRHLFSTGIKTQVTF